MTPLDRVHPFSNGSEFSEWTARNCDRCLRRGDTGTECVLELALVRAYFGDGSVSADEARRLNRVDGDRKSVCGERLLNATDQAEYDARLALPVWEVVRVGDGRVMASAHATAPEASAVMRSWNRNAMHGEKYTIRTTTEAT